MRKSPFSEGEGDTLLPEAQRCRARHVVPLPIDSLTRVQARREGELHAM